MNYFYAVILSLILACLTLASAIVLLRLFGIGG